MSARDAILAAVRRHHREGVPLPEPPAGITYADPEKQFAEALAGVGGTFARVADLAAVGARLASTEPYAGAGKVASLVPGAGRSTVDVRALRDPHELEGIDVAVLPGEFGVAENGAVWVAGSALAPHRALFVVAQHLVLVVPAGELVHNLHEAYVRLRLERPGFGVFVSGPSKTADIEQALVIGAHGARSCAVFLVG